ncbi:MAG TPA: right-handed parallel beta-helix repeat-containing protein [Pirellulaceae bacterium]|jgi:hypothetical protein|nr:right-handed parallel beta-helix repeat-containing protein [Pirellulaceae bacterium]
MLRLSALSRLSSLVLLWSGACLASSSLRGETITLHVSPSGNDRADGSAERPFATPHRALERLAEVAPGTRDAVLRIVFADGVHRLDRPIVLTGAHLPADGSLTFAAADGAAPIISGGIDVAGWTDAGEGVWQAPLPDIFRQANEGQSRPLPRELFVGDARRPRARHPNEGFVRIDAALPDRRSGFTFVAGNLPQGWTGGGELVFLHDWSISRIDVKTVDHASRTLTVAHPIGSAAPHYAIDNFEAHPRYFVENHRAFFDAPGEWLIDEAAGKILYRPREGETREAFRATLPLTPSLFHAKGDDASPLKNVRLQGLSFEHCAWPLPVQGYAAGQATYHDDREQTRGGSMRRFVPCAVTFEQAEGCIVADCRIAHLGGGGVSFGSRSKGCRIQGCTIEDVSGNGVMIGEDSARRIDGDVWWTKAPEQAASKNVVTRCRIERCGQQFFGAVAVWVGIAAENEISHDLIARHPYTGVSVGWIWNPTPSPAAGNVVSDNHIHTVMQILGDGGGIYTLGRQPGSKLLRNVIHDVPLNAGRAESNGMFLDEGTDQTLVAENVIYGVAKSPLRFHKAFSVRVENNVLVTPNAQTPPIAYNATDPDTIEKVDNRVVVEREFDRGAVKLPEVPTAGHP